MNASTFNFTSLSTNRAPWLVATTLTVLGLAILAFWIFSLSPGETTSGYSVAKLYNEANNYARNGKNGLAILNYERALLLAPGADDVRANLHWVRDHAGLPEKTSNLVERMLGGFGPTGLLCAGSLGLLVAGCAFLLGQNQPQRRWTFHAATGVGFALIAIALAGAWSASFKLKEAVAITEASARISPVSAGDVSFKLKEGEVVTVEAEYHNFILVKTDNEHRGWVSSSELSRVVPLSS